MRGFITRRFSETFATIGYYDMSKNEMVELDTYSGNWKTTEQVLKWCKKNKSTLSIPEGKQATVLSMETKTHLRKMTYETFYQNSVPVDEKETNKPAAKTNKKKGKR